MEQKNEGIARFLSGRDEGEAINLKAFICKLISYWRWFLPAVLIGVGAGMLYNWYTPATYAVTGSLFVKEKNEESISLDNLFDNLQLKSNVKIPNHIGILTSFKLNRQVIGNLGWDEGDQDSLTLDYMERLEVTRLDKNMDLISIRLITINPEKGIEYVNELENVYIRYGLREANQASENTIRFIDQQLAITADTLGKDNDLYAYLLEKRSEAEIAKASNVSDVEIIDTARDSTVEDVGPRKMINLLMGLFFGLAIPFLVIILRDFFDETIHRKEELEKLTPLPVFGSIGHSPYPGKMPVLQYPRSVVTESFRELRTNLESFTSGKDPIVAGIYSVVSMEGKSFVALNLACIIAMNNKKVMLIAADLRKPDLHEWMGLNNQRGLSTLLTGDDVPDQVILSTGVTNLDLIPSGPVPPNPAELLGAPAFALLISELKLRYDILIIDNAPSGVVTEGAIVRRYTDIDLFVIREGYTRKKLVDFVNQASVQNMKKAGIVFNDIHPERHGNDSGPFHRDPHSVNLYFTDS